MVRAILKNGIIEPLDPLPADWRDGEPLNVETTHPIDSPQAIEQWAREIRDPRFGVSPEDAEIVQRAIDEHRQEQKELMRKRMEAPDADLFA